MDIRTFKVSTPIKAGQFATLVVDGTPVIVGQLAGSDIPFGFRAPVDLAPGDRVTVDTETGEVLAVNAELSIDNP